MTQEATQTDEAIETVTAQVLDSWATDPGGPVALHMKQILVPVEQLDPKQPAVIYPPTYADIGYNIDTLSDGTKVVTIDSVGAQANRMEPMFSSHEPDPSKWLVPQIRIEFDRECGECDGCKEGKKCRNPQKENRSLLDLAHRSADAVVQSCPDLEPHIGKAFAALRRQGNAMPLCTWAPTSLVFGVWDSRGGTGEKRPRLVRSIIRAWDVEPLHAAAQFNSVWKTLGDETKESLKAEADKKGRKKLSDVGLKDAPAVFRKTDKIPKFRNGAVNPDARVLGGVRVAGQIVREVTVNLVALRGLRGSNDEESNSIRKYLLGLSLVAATSDIDLFLREGCHLRCPAHSDDWYQVPRRGEAKRIRFADDIQEYASNMADPFRKTWSTTDRLKDQKPFRFDPKEAQKLLLKKKDDDDDEAQAG